MAVKSNLIRWWRLSRHHKLLLFKALFFIIWATICLKCLPFTRIRPWLGQTGVVSRDNVSDTQMQQARILAWAVNGVSNHLPRSATCLQRALAFQHWLRRYDIPATVYLGVAKNPSAQSGVFQAHAWVSCGHDILMGKAGYEHFKPVAYFGWPNQFSAKCTPI